jgi:hypothetical protein
MFSPRPHVSHPWRPVRLLKWSLAAVAAAAAWLAVNYRVSIEYFTARARGDDEARAVGSLERRYGELQKQERELESWGFESERALRERFNMKLPGERVLIVEETPDPARAGAPIPSPPGDLQPH